MLNYLKCLTDRYGNYTKGKLYTIESNFITLDTKEPAKLFVTDDEHDTMYVESLMKRPGEFCLVLECSSKGDKRFSAYGAKVSVNGVFASIEEHYQLSKMFWTNLGHGQLGWRKCPTIKEVKLFQKEGHSPNAFKVGDFCYDIKYLPMWYDLLWVKYLDNNPDLVTYANTFGDFHDIFKGKRTMNCQADSIRKYVKQGRDFMRKECFPLIARMRNAKPNVINQ